MQSFISPFNFCHVIICNFKKVNYRWLIEYFYLKTDYRLGWIEIYVLFRWFFSTPLLSCFSFDPSVLFSSTALFRITPISVNDILASFPISYWFLPSFKSLKTSLFLSWLVITEIFLIIYLIILNRILKLLLPLVTYFVALLSSASNCYQCTVFEFWLSLIIPVMYKSDQMGIKIGNCTSSWSWISW